MTSRILDNLIDSQPIWSGNLIKGSGHLMDGRNGAQVKGNVETDQLLQDWSGFHSLQFTVYNPWAPTVIGGIEIYDQTAMISPDREYGDCIDLRRALLISEGMNHIVIQIDPIQTARGNRMLDLNNIAKLILRFPEPPENQEPITISSLRLSDYADKPDDISPPLPGHSILFIRHLDISCYTFQPENFQDPQDVKDLEKQVLAETDRLRNAITMANINGKQTLYARVALLTAEIALKSRPQLAWHFSPAAKRRNLSGALQELTKYSTQIEDLLSSRKHEDDEDDSNLMLPLVTPIPELKSLRIQDHAFVDHSGIPILICAMSYHNEGALLDFFAPEQHKVEIYAVGGGSRYDIEWSPVYEAFHKYPNTARVGWKGWCGHLIKDQWAMGGRRENVVICLENEHILQAIEQYNQEHLEEWSHLPQLMYAILGYELSYMCYCKASLARFREWLQERHETIEKLNLVWETEYADFAEALPPATSGHAPALDMNRAAWFDWADWNTRRFTDHLIWAKNAVRKLHPSIPLTAGGTSSMLSPLNSTTGIDEEMIINEVDDVILHEGNDLLSIDLFHAFSEIPKPLVDPEQNGDCSRWLLNYLHGKSAISMFWWPKQPSRQFPSSTMMSPAHGQASIAKVAEHFYTALDIRRLNKEISAFWKLTKEIALFYSKTNVLQVPPELMTGNTTPYLQTLKDSYEAARGLDTGITFISEKQLSKGNSSKYKLIILPAAKHISEPVFAALDRYIRDGGQLLVLPESLTSDEYNHPKDYLARWGVQVEATFSAEILGFGELVQRYDQNMERNVQYGKGIHKTSVAGESTFTTVPIQISGLFQKLAAPQADIFASDKAGNPLFLKQSLEKGFIWYAAGSLEPASLYHLLDRLFDEVEICRSLKVTDLNGERVMGLEARLIRRKHDDLVYVANESGRAVSFIIHTDRPMHQIRELRSLQYFTKPEGLIQNQETLLFSLREDPTIRLKTVNEPSYI